MCCGCGAERAGVAEAGEAELLESVARCPAPGLLELGERLAATPGLHSTHHIRIRFTLRNETEI